MTFKMIWHKISKMGLLRFVCKLLGTICHYPVELAFKTYLLHFTEVQEKRLLFCSTPSFEDNAKVLFEYIQDCDNGQKLEYIWLTYCKDSMPKRIYPNTQFVQMDSFNYWGLSLKALKYITTSKYIFFTHASPMKRVKKRCGQLIVNLWHGCGYKDVERRNMGQVNAPPFDIAIVPGQVFIKTKSKFWGCSEDKILPIAYPRYDLFYITSSKVEQFAAWLRGDAEKLVFWLPTFRNTGNEFYPEEKISYDFDLPLLKDESDVGKLNQFCQIHSITLCLKRHPFQIIYSCENNIYSNVKFISHQSLVDKNIELYSLFRYTDALISDYSSVAIDYLLLDKPIAFTLEDFDKFKETRGFVFDAPLQYMPGHHLYNFEDMLSFLEDIAEGRDPYSRDRWKLMPEVHNPCDNYCERVWKTILNMDVL